MPCHRECNICHIEIPADRLDRFPDTEYCVNHADEDIYPDSLADWGLLDKRTIGIRRGFRRSPAKTRRQTFRIFKNRLIRGTTEVGRCLICEERTFGQKPYCSDHVSQHPYVIELLSKLSKGVIRNESAKREANVRRDGEKGV